MRVDIKDLAVGAATAANPMLGLAANTVRHGAPKVDVKNLAVGAATMANPMLGFAVGRASRYETPKVKDLAVGAATMANPALGLAANVVRHRAPTDGNFLPNLGKSLSHHQIVPAVLQPRVANNPRTDFGKAVLSATGGNPRAVNQAIDGIRAIGVGQISHFDRKLQMAKGVSEALKLKPSVKSLISN
jgi:hypothetical protein